MTYSTAPLSINPLPISPSLQSIWQRGCEFLGTKTAIMAGAMTWVSNAAFVAAVSNGDGFGILACGSMSPELLQREIANTRALTNKPFGVNLITLHPDINQLIQVCGRAGVTHVVLAGGLPSSASIQDLKSYGCKVIGFAPALVLGQKLIKLGIDALIIEGSEAGGHIGPVSTNVLVQEILLPLGDKLPIFVAGGIGRGETIASFLQMGAAGCQLGTRFVCAHESPAHHDFKQAFIRAQARDAVVSVQLDPRFPVIPVRALSNAASRKFATVQANIIRQYEEGHLDLKQAQLEVEHYWAGALRKAVIDGDIENGSLMAGQSVGMVNKEQTAAEIIKELILQANQFLDNNPPPIN